MKKILLILMLITASLVSFTSCKDEEDYNNDLGGTTWVWTGSYDMVHTLKFLDERRATIKKNYFGMSLDYNYSYTYDDKNKTGTLAGEGDYLSFTKNNNKIVIDGDSYYKQ